MLDRGRVAEVAAQSRPIVLVCKTDRRSAKAAEVSVFIDIIGMPMTPLSYAGVGRRTYRRAFYR